MNFELDEEYCLPHPPPWQSPLSMAFIILLPVPTVLEPVNLSLLDSVKNPNTVTSFLPWSHLELVNGVVPGYPRPLRLLLD